MDSLTTFDYASLIPLGIEYGTKIIVFILAYIIGSWLISKAVKGIEKLTTKKNVDPTLSSFLLSFVGGALKVLLILSLVGYIGIEVTSFVAILGAASLAIGMALSGTLQNFAGGVMLLLFKPYKVGDFIELGGFSGEVKEIQIFNTVLLTGDNKTVIIPNAECSSSSLVNYSAEGKRRVDMTFGIGYGDDIDKARTVLKKVFDANTMVLSDEGIKVIVHTLGASSVDMQVRSWCKAEDYWDMYFEMNETVKKAFDKENISFPFPQREVTMLQK